MDATFDCTLVTPERALFDKRVVHAQVPGHDGQFGILLHRAPMIYALGIGPLIIRLPNDKIEYYAIDGGFAEMRNNRLTLICERAWPATELRIQELARQLEQATLRPAKTPEARQQREHDIHCCKTMLMIAERAQPSRV